MQVTRILYVAAGVAAVVLTSKTEEGEIPDTRFRVSGAMLIANPGTEEEPDASPALSVTCPLNPLLVSVTLVVAACPAVVTILAGFPFIEKSPTLKVTKTDRERVPLVAVTFTFTVLTDAKPHVSFARPDATNVVGAIEQA